MAASTCIDATYRASLTPRLVAGRPVDTFAEKIGVAVVACVLLDHVQVDPADGLLADDPVERVARGGGPAALHLLGVGGEHRPGSGSSRSSKSPSGRASL